MMGMKSRKRMEEEKKQKKNYIGLKHSMKTMTTTTTNNKILGIMFFKMKHSHYEL